MLFKILMSDLKRQYGNRLELDKLWLILHYPSLIACKRDIQSGLIPLKIQETLDTKGHSYVALEDFVIFLLKYRKPGKEDSYM